MEKNNFVFPSEARPNSEFRLPEQCAFFTAPELDCKWKKVDKKKGTTTTHDRRFLYTPISLANVKKSISFWRKSQDFVKEVFFWDKEKFQDFVIFYKKLDFGMAFSAHFKISTLNLEFGQIFFSF
jgi:hypothetical protein